MSSESICPDDVIRDLLPGYVAGSLFPDEHALVEAALQRSPLLLAEAKNLKLVNQHLLETRLQLEREQRLGRA